MLLWCLVSIMLDGSQVETSVKGKMMHEAESFYILDFSEYAKKQGYEGDYSSFTVNKDYCTKDVE